MAKSNLKVVSDVTNGGKSAIEQGFPYAVAVRAQGAADLLFHRWNCESVDAKSKAAKNSAAKKTDDIESYVWRNEKEEYEKATGKGQMMKNADQLAKVAKTEKALQNPTYVSKVSKK